jgi:putative ATPase
MNDRGISMKKEFRQPLADRMRPNKLDDFEGQEEIVGEKSFLKKAILQDEISSLIFWGPPGSGKTTLAFIIAKETKADFIFLSAVESGVKKLREIIKRAKSNRQLGQKTIVFIDEIHRWNKAQQDSLLPNIEKGNIILIGATTENPSFELNSALLSRTRVIVLKKLSKENLIAILKNALKDKKNGLGYKKIKIRSKVIELIDNFSNGDSRTALNILEACSNVTSEISDELLENVLQKSHLFYDKNGEEHYNIISALHKSMRGGDANASIYWLVRMLEGGENPLYIARRLIRFASEDIGLINNTALLLANACFEACHNLGMPECGIILTQCVIYLAKSKKSILAYQSYQEAQKDVEKYGNLPVPIHLRNAPTKLMKELNYGKDYKYTPLENSSEQNYLPQKLKNKKYVK